jgi:hypothetical protein
MKKSGPGLRRFHLSFVALKWLYKPFQGILFAAFRLIL